MSDKRLEPTERRQRILATALTLAGSAGYKQVTREQIAGAADVSPALVTRYFGSMAVLRHKIMAEAVRQEVLGVVAQGLAAHDAVAKLAPLDLKRRAIATLS